jgi:exopolysaccharide biosynthesis WecB/TagA/CpsF family protein
LPTFVARLVQTRRGTHAAARLRCEIDDYDLGTFLDVAARFGQERFGYVVTPNADHLIRLHESADFRDLYSNAEYVLLDSQFLSRLVAVTKRLTLPVCTGSGLTARLLAEVIVARDPIVVIGGDPLQVALLRKRFGLTHLVHFNPPMGFSNDPVAVEDCLRFIETHSPFRFCLLAVGAPRQEMLAQRLKARGIARGLALCVGASIDFITGAERRAPAWMQHAGLEWLFRLAQNPARMAGRYLVRGPRVFGLLRNTTFVLRARRNTVLADLHSDVAQAASLQPARL